MRSGFFSAILIVACLQAAEPEDPRLKPALSAVARQASEFWQKAPGFVAQERLRQQSTGSARASARRLHLSVPEKKKGAELERREIVSWYGFGVLNSAPEALREFRAPITVEGAAPQTPPTEQQFASMLGSGADEEKNKLLAAFESATAGGQASDFGQLLLLFTRQNQHNYEFDLQNTGRIGPTKALVIQFQQRSGSDSFRITEGKKRLRQQLQGELWVRDKDYQVLRISLENSQLEHGWDVRDEAAVEYSELQPGLPMPVSMVHRRLVSNKLFQENNAVYTNWHPGALPK